MKLLKKKLLFLIVLAGCFFFAAPASAKEINFFQTCPRYPASPKVSNPRILLIGNSLTYYNYNNHGIKYILENLCKADGINASITDITLGGHFLYETPNENDPLHSKVEQALSQRWDYVILQGHSRETLPEYQNKFLQSIETYFKPKIDACGAQMVLYMTWAPDRDPYNDNSAYSRDQRQSHITNVYYSLGSHFKCAVAPSGLAFARAKELYPDIELHYSKTDRLHPNRLGTYLSACTIYATLFNRNPYSNSYYDSAVTSKTQSGNLRSIAADVTIYAGTSGNARLTFGSKEYVLSKGQSKTLSPKISSGGRVIRWTSSAPEVVTVKAVGFSGCKLQAVSNGKATITALLNNNTSVSCNVYVAPQKIALGAKEKCKLEVAGSFKWKSSKPSVASISGCTITGKKKGTATLTGTNSAGTTLKVTVSVKSAPASVKVKKVPYVPLGRTAPLKAYISSGYSAAALTYKSSNPNIISIDKNGLMTGKRAGQVSITAKAYNGKKVKCTVRCIIPAQKIACKNAASSFTLKKGKTLTLKVGFTPSNTSIRTLKWKSSNKKVVSVSSKGKLKAIKKGTATITATTTDGTNLKIKLKVKVK